MSEEPVYEVVHEVNHHLTPGVPQDRSYAVHGETSPASGVDEKEGKLSANFINNTANIRFECSQKRGSLDFSAMLFKSLL